MVIDSSREDVKRLLVRSFSSDLIRFYYGEDLIGNEVGAAAKNVVGIAAGFLDGKGLSSLNLRSIVRIQTLTHLHLYFQQLYMKTENL